MASIVFSRFTASISELKKNPMKTVAAGEGFPVAILNRNEPTFYCVPAKAYEALMERIENAELDALAESRKDRPVTKAGLDEL